MRIVFFSSKPHDRQYFQRVNSGGTHELVFMEERLSVHSASAVGGEGAAVCAFVNDVLSREVLSDLARRGTRLVLLRCAGFNNVDLVAAGELGLTVAHVPAYSPFAVAEHAVALLLSVTRKLHKAYARVREGNYALEGLCGFDLHGRTVGVVGVGTIGLVFARIMKGFGCNVIAFDPAPSAEAKALGVEFVDLNRLFSSADIVSLHCPLVAATHHIVDEKAIGTMKPGVTLINTGRGALVDTKALIGGLKSRHVGAVGLDVYEEEASVFFEDHLDQIIDDDVLMRLVSFPNVLLTSHQGFFTREALTKIAEVTFANAAAFESGSGELFEVKR